MSYCSNLNLYQIVLECCFCFEVEQTRISTTYLVTLVAENCFATNVLASLSLSLSLSLVGSMVLGGFSVS